MMDRVMTEAEAIEAGLTVIEPDGLPYGPESPEETVARNSRHANDLAAEIYDMLTAGVFPRGRLTAVFEALGELHADLADLRDRLQVDLATARGVA